MGEFSIFRLPFDELKYRLDRAWLRLVAARVSHRDGFLDFAASDPGTTRAFVNLLPVTHQALFRNPLNGAHFTAYAFHHWTSAGDLCPFCQCTDSRYRRFWQCWFFEEERASLPPGLLDLVPTLPEFLTCYGWSIAPPTLTLWERELLVVSPFTDPASVEVFGDTGPLCLFTDASAQHPGDATLRFASWSVAQGVARGSLAPNPVLLLLEACLAFFKSAYRGELYAVLVALTIAVECQRPVYLWCDCEGVVKGLRRLCSGQKNVRPNSKHADLWTAIAQQLSLLEVACHVFHVPAHRSADDAQIPTWIWLHNQLADRGAVLAT